MKNRFETKYKITESGCWEWTASKNKLGYGKLANGKGGWVLAHRASYSLHKSPEIDGFEVCHSCDNPSCVNPEHLFLGTHAQNMLDCKEKGRAIGHKGERNPNAKLSEQDVAEIRASNKSSSYLAEKYEVTPQLIKKIIARELWA